MPSLKDLKVRINSVKSTQKITSAMKMVAASKLRRAQEQVEASRPFADRMDRMMSALAQSYSSGPEAAEVSDVPPIMKGTGSDKVQLLVVITSDRGLCGAFNGAIVREARRRLQALQKEGKTTRLICVGRKGRDLLRREYGSSIIESYEEVGKRRSLFAEAEAISQKILTMFDGQQFDVCTLYYNKFKSVIAQVPTAAQLIPVPPPAPKAAAKPTKDGPRELLDQAEPAEGDYPTPYEFEPEGNELLTRLLPYSVTVRVYGALLESAASEQGARMTAMDNATRNAGDMIQRLTLNYNRTRQAAITKELIEIISGAEAI